MFLTCAKDTYDRLSTIAGDIVGAYTMSTIQSNEKSRRGASKARAIIIAAAITAALWAWALLTGCEGGGCYSAASAAVAVPTGVKSEQSWSAQMNAGNPLATMESNNDEQQL